MIYWGSGGSLSPPCCEIVVTTEALMCVRYSYGGSFIRYIRVCTIILGLYRKVSLFKVVHFLCGSFDVMRHDHGAELSWWSGAFLDLVSFTAGVLIVRWTRTQITTETMENNSDPISVSVRMEKSCGNVSAEMQPRPRWLSFHTTAPRFKSYKDSECRELRWEG